MDKPEPSAFGNSAANRAETKPSPTTSVAAPSVYELEGSKKPLPLVPILIAGAVIAACVSALLYFTHPPPVVSGGITKIVPVEQVTKDRVLVTVETTVRNLSPQEIVVKGVDAKIVTPQGEARDVPAPASDLPRYFKAYPELQQSEAAPLIDNTRIAPGAEQRGMFVVGFPVTKDAFNKRQSLEVTIHFYGQRPLVLMQ